MAQYQELESFAQFGSELDKESQAQLARGQRMKQLLIQPQYNPMLVQEQVLVLFAGTHGYVDDIAVKSVLVYQEKMLTYVRAKYPQLLERIAKEGIISEELEKEIKAVLDEYKPIFKESK